MFWKQKPEWELGILIENLGPSNSENIVSDRKRSDEFRQIPVYESRTC